MYVEDVRTWDSPTQAHTYEHKFVYKLEYKNVNKLVTFFVSKLGHSKHTRNMQEIWQVARGGGGWCGGGTGLEPADRGLRGWERRWHGGCYDVGVRTNLGLAQVTAPMGSRGCLTIARGVWEVETSRRRRALGGPS